MSFQNRFWIMIVGMLYGFSIHADELPKEIESIYFTLNTPYLIDTIISFESTDSNEDGMLEYWVTDNHACGSSGCNGSIFIKVEGKYCYAGNSDTFESAKAIKNGCQKTFVHLSDL